MIFAALKRRDPRFRGDDSPQSASPRSSSFTLVLLRVFASTCLTITAQYSECEPSFAGNCPDTTTLYGGTEMDVTAGRASQRAVSLGLKFGK